jgi:hypothetical protein
LSSEFSIDFSQEPRKVFLNLLLWNIKIVEDAIYVRGRDNDAISLLMGLIDSLDDASKKRLDRQHKKLLAFQQATEILYPGQIEQIYREVLTYLHETYLREVNYVRPLNPKPKHITDGDNK